MANYGVAQAGFNGPPNQGLNLTDLIPGEAYYLWNAETPAPGTASVAFSRGYSPSADDVGITFQIFYASAPTAVLVIQASNVDIDGNYQTVYTSTNLQNDNYTSTTRWAFYRAKLVSQSAGGAVTVLAQR